MIASTAFSPTPRTAIMPKRMTPSVFVSARLRLPPGTVVCTYAGVKSLSDMFTSGGNTFTPREPSGISNRRHSSMYSTTFSVDPISNVSTADMYSTG